MAIEPSMFSASSASRDSGSVASSSRRRKTSVSPNTDAVSHDGQRRVLLEDAARDRQRGVQAVAELVGERQHVAAAAV